MKKIAEIFAENLKVYRKAAGLTQQQLAERLGVSVLTVQNYESRRRWPSPDSIYMISKALNVPETAFFRESGRSLNEDVPPEKLLLKVAEALGVTIERKKPSGKK